MILLRDQLALRFAVEAADPVLAIAEHTARIGSRTVRLVRECPACKGWGEITDPGAGPLGTDLSAPCETCNGRGSLPDADD